MHMALNSRIIFFSFLLFLSCSFNGETVYGAAGQDQRYHTVPGKTLIPNSSCHHPPTDGSSTLGPQKLRVTYNPKPCPKKRPPGSESTTASAYAINDQQLVPTKSASVEESMGQYTVKIDIGTPKTKYSLIIDTGSDISWIKCSGESPSGFNPSLSSSFSKGGCVSKEPNYDSTYGDNSHSYGFYGCDTLTVEDDVFTQFQFGCGQVNKGEFSQADGILGLGQGPLSFVSQTASKTGKSFSYCLPSKPESTGYLLFGNQAYSSFQASRVYTPLLTIPLHPSYYFVKLVGITVGATRLKISPSVFSSSGTILDSGTTITRLPAPAYSAMKAEFRKLMKNYPPASPPGDDQLLDTCYDLKPYIHTNVMVPKVMLHFDGGATVNLDASGILWTEEGQGGGVSCLAFAAKKPVDWSIIGSTQQKTMDVHYDLKNRKVGFGMNACP